MPPQQVIIFIIGTVVVLFGAYYVTYYIGAKASGQPRAGLRNRNIAVLDRFSIARDKSFCIVEIAGKVYIVGITTNSMTVMDTYDAEEFAELTEANSQAAGPVWSDTPVGRYGNKLTRKVVAFVAEKTGKVPKEQTGKENNTNVKAAGKASFKEQMRAAESKDAGVDSSKDEETGSEDKQTAGEDEDKTGGINEQTGSKDTGPGSTPEDD